MKEAPAPAAEEKIAQYAPGGRIILPSKSVVTKLPVV
jgi:hypothetical protein